MRMKIFRKVKVPHNCRVALSTGAIVLLNLLGLAPARAQEPVEGKAAAANVVQPVSVKVVSGGTEYGPETNIIDGKGLSGEGPVLEQKHNSHPTNMWLSAKRSEESGDSVEGLATLVFDLGDVYTVNAVHVWNFGEVILPRENAEDPGVLRDLTTRGASEVELTFDAEKNDPAGKPVSLSFQQASWEPSQTLAEGMAWGMDFTVPAVACEFPPVRARYIKMKIISNYGAEGSVGLSEIRFGIKAPEERK